MGDIREPAPVLLVTSAFSRYEAALRWARERASEAWGAVALESPRFDFTETDYYQPAMGPDLKKVFWAFERLISPADLPGVKHETNRWEQEYAALGWHPEPRPLNLDPGYLTPGKLILASTKDHSHRIYLSQGIYGEVTLHYRDGRWRQRDWTFPDYLRDDYHQFFTACRRWLRERQSRP